MYFQSHEEYNDNSKPKNNHPLLSALCERHPWAVLDYLRLAPVIQILLRGPYPRPSRPASRVAAFAFIRFGEQVLPTPECKSPFRYCETGLVGSIGFEPTTPSMSRKYSNQLS